MIVAITGFAGSGKSTLAKHLCDVHGFRRVPFAGPLKSMLIAAGLTTDHTDGELKELPCELLGGQTPRHAMQTLGTDWGRKMISPDLWVRLWSNSAQQALDFGASIVVDDARFENEIDAVRALGGTVINVTRPGYGPKDHPSEHGVDYCDIRIENCSRPEAMFSLAESALGLARPSPDEDRCIPVDLGDKGTGYVVRLMCNDEETHNPKTTTHVVAMMISGPWAGMLVTVPISEAPLELPIYH